jgi:Tfp pilus assembly protein PilZ
MKGDYSFLQPDKDKERHSSRIKTLGGGGVMILSTAPLSVGTRLLIRLFHYPNIITVNSKVVWAEPREANKLDGFRVGLQFSPPTQSSLLHIEFLLMELAV